VKAYASAEDIQRRVCGSKRRYPTADAARQAADRVNREQPTAGFSPYRCPFCRRWHFGHSPSIESLEATARVLRGLPPTAPEPHEPPERERRRRRRKDRMTTTDIVQASTPEPPPGPGATGTDLVAWLRSGIANVDRRRQELAEAGEWETLAFGLVSLKQIASDLQTLIRGVEDDVARLLPEKRAVVEGLGVIERRQSSERRAWRSDELLDELLRLAVADPETGEVLDDEAAIRARFVQVLVDCVPFTGSLKWRLEALRELGIDPDEWCETKPGRTTVQVVR
jgi:hypothetical protein